MMGDMTRTVAIDFDGVLHAYTRGWTGIVPEDPPVPGSKQFVSWLVGNGFDPVVFSTRATSGRGRIEVEHWLMKHGFPKMKVVGDKPGAILYVDDRGFAFGGNFFAVIEFLKANPSGASWVEGLCP